LGGVGGMVGCFEVGKGKQRNGKEINNFIYLLITNKIILCGYILLKEHLLRCVSWSKLGKNDCFVPEEGITT
ncbi:hypothetical protein, partial [Serratia nevei]